jgi:hypothetical protein
MPIFLNTLYIYIAFHLPLHPLQNWIIYSCYIRDFGVFCCMTSSHTTLLAMNWLGSIGFRYETLNSFLRTEILYPTSACDYESYNFLGAQIMRWTAISPYLDPQETSTAVELGLRCY